ncbi:MAG TPA: peptide-methionine (S)-S-oxide reductase MsrA [Chloroflexota bacterium]|nr:peptide-methionine (S)-S-oxide reductase MsrA [Chloroflexota bacterium]
MATFLDRFPDPARDIDPSTVSGEQTAVLAGGCFWCVEAVFEPVQGVIDAVSGYAGGTKETADYQTVCSGMTDHAEAVRIRYDPQRITYGQILKLFFSIAHDPTQLNRQGNDMGRQYRSAIFYADDAQKEVAEAYIRQLDEAHVFDAPIVTTLEPLNGFYEAEDYHQDYAERNPWQPYIAYTAAPKVKKLHQYYGDKLKGASK